MAAPRSILWIVTTQWRAQACGFTGDPNVRTPGLDALAAQGITFAQAVTPHPFGPFARAAMLTGVRSPANGVRDYFDPLPLWREGTTAGRTIAHRLNALGYATAFFGKWHLGRRDPAEPLVGEAHARTLVPPEARGGFGHWEGFESGFLLNDPWLHGTGFPQPRQFRGYQSDVLGERAAEWMAAAWSGTAPWCCVVSLEPPHPPYDAPAPGAPRHAAEDIVLAANVPRGGAAEQKARAELAGYYAHIEATDRAIGRLVSASDAAEAARGRPAPIVVCTSVHGDMHGAHGLFRKGWPHEESVRVPLLVRDGATGGVTSELLVSLLDLPRWTEAWARGADVHRRLAPPQAQMLSMPSVVRLPQQCDRVWRAVRTRSRKLVLNADGTPWLLFDLENDPAEQCNLADDPRWHAEIARLQRLAAADASDTASPPR